MKKTIILLLLCLYAPIVVAQYEPGAINYGLVLAKPFGAASELGAGLRIEYASNCYTTFLGEYNRYQSFGSETESGYNELAFGVNLILFNWYPTTITAGMGYVGNDSGAIENIEEEGYLVFKTGSLNHGAQIKLRAMHQASVKVHIFAELNIKSIAQRYDTFLIGLSYDFDAR